MKSAFTLFCTLCLLLSIHFISAQPVISAFSPTSGPIGTSVVISGSNFSTTPANNIVYIGAVKAPVSQASSTSLTVTIPAGATYLPVTVTTNGLTAYAAQPFNVAFPGGGAITTTSFAKRLNFQLTPAYTETISSDLDGDGKAELLFLYPNRVAVFRNTSSGENISFGGEQSFFTPCPYGFSLADIDGDGKPDIVASDRCNSVISIQRNTSSSGSISFAAKQDIPTTPEGFPYKLEVGDLDGDGRPDIATVNMDAFTLSIFRNTTTGGIISFAPKVDYSTAGFPRNLVLADLNNDGKTDVVVANQGSHSISVFKNNSTNGNISFNSRLDYSTTASSSPEHVSAADFDGDGMIDLAVTNNNDPGTLSVFRNLGTGGASNILFSSKIDFQLGAGSYPYSLAVADLDGDGKPDLAVSNQSLGALSVLRNASTAGNISFASKVDFATGSVGRKHVSSIDVNADGKPDLVLVDDDTNNTAVYVNMVEGPIIKSFTPVAAGTTSLVTITGANFTGTTAVKFGGTDAASFTVVNATTINAVLGSGTSGDVTVTSPLGTGILSGFTFTGAVSTTACYWVGASNSNWNNSNNWSSTAGGPGGVGVPGATDSVIILYEPGLNIKMDVSTTIGSLTVTKSLPGGDTYSQKVTLYTGTKTTLTILKSLFIYSANLVDSTTEDASFKLILNGARQATGSISNGALTFAGRVPVTNGNGSTLIAEPGSKLTVQSGGSIYSCANSAYIECDPTSLDFSLQSGFIMKSNPDASIPNATYEPDYIQYANVPYNPPPVVLTISGASIIIDGKLDKIKYPNPKVQFRALYLNLDEQDKDATLALPDSSGFNSLSINNTSGYTLTLLGNGSGSSSMFLSAGNFYINGSTTKVALATATASVPSISYRFQTAFYTQTAGNFSLQDFDGATGPSTLAISRDLVQSGGTFFTNSSSTNANAKFLLEMNGGDFVYSRSYMGNLSNGQSISMSSGNIDNGKRNVVFRVNTPLMPYNGYVYDDKGVFLKSPLSVFRLELLKGALNTTLENLITINDPDAAKGITTGNYAESFIAGPFKVLTSSTVPYTIPTGAKGSLHIYDYYRPFTITPASAAPSVYQISYLNNSYADLNVMAPLKAVSALEFWTVNKLSGSDATIKLPFYKVIDGSSSVDEVVVAQYKDGSWTPANGTKLPPGTKDSTMVESKLLTSYGAFTLGYGVIGSDTVISGATCRRDTTIYADPATCKATVNWPSPADLFADTYNIGTSDKLHFKGAFNGHGYYISEGNYDWETAKTAAENARGHLVTITSAAENNFILKNLVDPQRQELLWIGLRNTGKFGQFGWITAEPLSYTFWKPGEPNNYYNDPTSNDIVEPYVHINGYEGNKWNDIGYASSRFIAEFDSALVSYRQYSGPESGSMLSPGVYTVCYERTDHQTGKHDSCCFNITVTCTGNNNGAESLKQDKFDVTAFPNPTTGSFQLRLEGIASDEEVQIEVTDAFGRRLELKKHLVVKNVFQFGRTYRPGMYFAKITKGKKVITVKLIKQ